MQRSESKIAKIKHPRFCLETNVAMVKHLESKTAVVKPQVSFKVENCRGTATWVTLRVKNCSGKGPKLQSESKVAMAL